VLSQGGIRQHQRPGIENGPPKSVSSIGVRAKTVAASGLIVQQHTLADRSRAAVPKRTAVGMIRRSMTGPGRGGVKVKSRVLDGQNAIVIDGASVARTIESEATVLGSQRSGVVDRTPICAATVLPKSAVLRRNKAARIGDARSIPGGPGIPDRQTS